MVANLCRKMLLRLSIIIFFYCLPVSAFSQEQIVFKSGTEGYASYRIPAIITGKDGTLFAFAEGRVDHAGDFGNVDIVYKISKNKGKTWSKLQVAVDYKKIQAGNSAPVVDLFDPAYPKGRIFLFYNTGNNHESEVRKGMGLREVWYITSTDGAKTWSDPVNITHQVHRPMQTQANPAYNFKEDWRTFANTPGHGLQFAWGPNKGRIYIAANHNSGDPQKNNKDWNANGYYSDDHGKTFKISSDIPFPGSNESSVAQVGENTLYMSSRNQQLVPKQRIVSVSTDGGVFWESKLDPQLPDPISQGSVLSWKRNNQIILAHINAADEANRDKLTLRLSTDLGKSWYWNKVIAKSPPNFTGAYAAYSDIVLIGKNKMGILYEKDNYKEIVFTIQHFQ